LAVVGSFFVLSSARAASVTLAWDPSPSPDVTGYIVYYGDASASYSQAFDVGNSTTATLSNLANGNAYFVVVTAYNGAGMQSVPSNQISFQVTNGVVIPNGPSSQSSLISYSGDFNGDGKQDIFGEIPRPVKCVSGQ
jgi:hypothetical protein